MRGRPRQRRQDETKEKKTKRRRVENGQIQFHGLLEWMALHIKDISLSPVVHSFRPLFSRERKTYSEGDEFTATGHWFASFFTYSSRCTL